MRARRQVTATGDRSNRAKIFATPIEQVIQQLEEERNRIDRAIQVLKGIPSGTIPSQAQTKAVSSRQRPAAQNNVRIGPQEDQSRAESTMGEGEGWEKIAGGRFSRSVLLWK